MTTTSNAPIKDGGAARLLEILELDQIEQDLYLGQNEHQRSKRLFGGQVLAQATAAAYRTVEDVHVHSLHAYFIQAGSPDRPVLYEIERIRDGRSFTTRRVVAVQNGVAIFNMDISFQLEELGFDHANAIPNVPLPEELGDDVEAALEMPEGDPGLGPMSLTHRPFEMRSVFRPGSAAAREDRSWHPTWIRFREQVDPGDARLSRVLLAYASDMSLVSTASLPHQSEIPRGQLQTASLDHALWIHRPVPIDQWLLFHKRTSTAQGARGLVHAALYARSGEMIASVTQEGLIRPPKA